MRMSITEQFSALFSTIIIGFINLKKIISTDMKLHFFI